VGGDEIDSHLLNVSCSKCMQTVHFDSIALASTSSYICSSIRSLNNDPNLAGDHSSYLSPFVEIAR
jgi:hypothetical protein